MILHLGERVFWGAAEVIYLEGTIRQLDEGAQSVIVHVDRATPHSAHLIDSDVSFAANGVTPLKGDSPPGVTSERNLRPAPAPRLSDAEKISRAASVAVHQQYGYSLAVDQEQALIEQVAQALNSDAALRTKIIASMNEILQREF